MQHSASSGVAACFNYELVTSGGMQELPNFFDSIATYTNVTEFWKITLMGAPETIEFTTILLTSQSTF